LIHISNEDFEKLPRISSLNEATSDKAYVLLKDEKPIANEVVEDGKVAYLVVNGKEFSKIYNGLYGKIVIDWNLPLTLPEVEKYEPAGDGQGPLARIDNWVNVKLAENLQ
jgi:lysine/ornithine N-monooxygenase